MAINMNSSQLETRLSKLKRARFRQECKKYARQLRREQRTAFLREQTKGVRQMYRTDDSTSSSTNAK